MHQNLIPASFGPAYPAQDLCIGKDDKPIFPPLPKAGCGKSRAYDESMFLVVASGEIDMREIAWFNAIFTTYLLSLIHHREHRFRKCDIALAVASKQQIESSLEQLDMGVW